MKTLLISDSWDATSDIIVRRLSSNIFRLNSDMVRDFKISWEESGFQIVSPSGLLLDSAEVSSVYWRKPFTSELYDEGHPDAYFYSEARYLIRELYNVLLRSGAYALVEEGAERRLGKISQLLIAKKYFLVPPWRVFLGHDYVAPEETIIKSMSGEQISNESVLYTSRADGLALDPSFIWLAQKAVQRNADVTVCFIDGHVLGFDLDEIANVTDWRTLIGQPETRSWRHRSIDVELSNAITYFMDECGLRYGRLDFLAAKDGRLYFLEVNPNGQWAWLDPNDEVGLISLMATAISRRLRTPRHNGP